MYEIFIDISKETVTLGRQTSCRLLRRQWVVFYLAMALRSRAGEAPSSFLEAQELHLLGLWFSKKVESIGKEVARHLQDLSEDGMGDLVFHDGRTKRWRLNVPPEQITFLPSRAMRVLASSTAVGPPRWNRDYSTPHPGVDLPYHPGTPTASGRPN